MLYLQSFKLDVTVFSWMAGSSPAMTTGTARTNGYRYKSRLKPAEMRQGDNLLRKVRNADNLA
jgi:hypothetical protein